MTTSFKESKIENSKETKKMEFNQLAIKVQQSHRKLGTRDKIIPDRAIVEVQKKWSNRQILP